MVGDGLVLIQFFVSGTPRPQGSKRAIPTPSGKVNLVESSKGHADWRGDVRTVAAATHTGPPLQGPVSVTLGFYMPRPKRHPKTKTTYPTGRPDADKLARAILDSLTGIVFADDAQVTDLRVVKRWHTEHPQLRPGVSVLVSGLEGLQ